MRAANFATSNGFATKSSAPAPDAVFHHIRASRHQHWLIWFLQSNAAKRV